MPDRNDRLIAAVRARLAKSSAFSGIVARTASARVEVTGAAIEARALILATLQETTRKRIAVVVPGDASLDDLESALRLFHRDPGCVAVFPSPSLSPYQEVAPSLAVTRDEIRALGRLASNSVDILIVPSRVLFSRLPRREDFAGRVLPLREGEDLDLRAVLQQLVENGYVRTDLVGEVGEFAFRGGILDLFPPNASHPIRIELFGDTIESIRHFEVESQRSDEKLQRFSAEPMSQFSATPQIRKALARRLSLDFMEPLYKRDLADKIDRINEHGGFPGVEHYLPLVAPSVGFADYIDLDGDWMLALMESDQITSTIAKYESLLRSEWEQAAEKGRAAYPPDKLLIPGSDILSMLSRARLALSDLHVELREFEEIRLHAGSVAHYTNRLSELTTDLNAGHDRGRAQIFLAATKGGREKVERLLTEFNVPFSDNSDAIRPELVVTPGHLPRGFDFDEIELSVYSEWDLFEPPTSARVASRKRASESFVTDLRDLKAGDYIVHVDHGVGRFVGLQRIAFGDTDREVMELAYAGAGKLLMPMESLNLIQKYSGGGDAQPKLDKLGGTSWARTKASVKKAMRDMADELLKLYATRQMVQGHAFSKDSPWQFDFEESFEFEETEDQLNAIDDVKADMESRKPMDRLLCGDVGYGKTEVAMRAAFKSVMDGKQVAILAPTTILAYQHYRTLLRRFASFPVTIELLTRYYSPKEQKAIVDKLESGEIDVIIGTHRVLSKDIQFKDLGFLVIDEEQRFGVAQKERLKQLKKAVDVLSMSATPIPRTLNMSLVGIRDISVIETPPKDRLAIQTAVVPFNDDFIREAIDFEINRGGQIFFVHNRVESIDAMKEYLEKLVPGVRVIVGHGQMDERELERAMFAFINREYDVLLATTIIENGIDIPACNTILINHAERFGLSQLYQLRGRVGRSDRLAFCYLLVPSDKILSSDARKRLAAIQEFSDLGAGFRIAARDLEIRGSGNLLGGEQSGQIAAVGFEMYCKLLEEAVREMKGERVEEEVETSMNLGVDIYIPPEYVSDENLRMTFYKKIASARNDSRLADIRNELRDRFGALPANVENLIRFVTLKRLAQSLGVVSIVRERGTAVLKLSAQAKVDPNRLLQLIQQDPRIKFAPSGALSVPIEGQGGEVIDRVEGLLQSIAVSE
jgi:transcription-repair coupling factor (superfamily II helicase)